jgi:hypothetical protein
MRRLMYQLMNKCAPSGLDGCISTNIMVLCLLVDALVPYWSTILVDREGKQEAAEFGVQLTNRGVLEVNMWNDVKPSPHPSREGGGSTPNVNESTNGEETIDARSGGDIGVPLGPYLVVLGESDVTYGVSSVGICGVGLVVWKDKTCVPSGSHWYSMVLQMQKGKWVR